MIPKFQSAVLAIIIASIVPAYAQTNPCFPKRNTLQAAVNDYKAKHAA